MKLDDSSKCDCDCMEDRDTGDHFLVKLKMEAKEKCFVGIIDDANDTDYKGRLIKRKECDEFLEADVFIYEHKNECSFF